MTIRRLFVSEVPFERLSLIEFSHNTQSWQHWHLIQMHQNILRMKKKSIFLKILMYYIQKISFPLNSLVYIFIRILGENDFFFLLWIFLAERALLFNWKYFWGWNLVWTTCRWHADDVWMTCGWHDSETSGEISLEDDICCLHIICTSYGWHRHVIRMSCRWHLHVICTMCGQCADDKRQQLCIKPTGFLVDAFELDVNVVNVVLWENSIRLNGNSMTNRAMCKFAEICQMAIRWQTVPKLPFDRSHSNSKTKGIWGILISSRI